MRKPSDDGVIDSPSTRGDLPTAERCSPVASTRVVVDPELVMIVTRSAKRRKHALNGGQSG